MISFFARSIIQRSLAMFFLASFVLTSCTKHKYAYSSQEEYFKLPNWNNKVASFKKMDKPAHTTTVFIGDSITEGFDLQQFYHDENVLNMGISGDYTSGILMRLEPLIRLHPKKIFIMIGINDIRLNVPIQTIQSNYSDIINLIRKKCPESQLFVQSNLPCDQSVSAELTNEVLVNHVRELNGFLQSQCAEKGATFINLYPLFEIEGTRLDPKLTYDGLHLNHEGYVVWKEAIQALMAN